MGLPRDDDIIMPWNHYCYWELKECLNMKISYFCLKLNRYE